MSTPSRDFLSHILHLKLCSIRITPVETYELYEPPENDETDPIT